MGKATTIYAVNGTEILLPCTFSSCFGFENLHFWWSYNSSDTYKIVSGRRRDMGQLRSSSRVCPFTPASHPRLGPIWTDPSMMVPRGLLMHLLSPSPFIYFKNK